MKRTDDRPPGKGLSFISRQNRVTVTFGIDTYEAYLKWCGKAKKMIGD